MVSLLDITRLTENVPFRGDFITVGGINAKQIAKLMSKYDDVRVLLAGKELNLTPEKLIELVPQAAGDIIEMACDAHDSGMSDNLTVGEQIDILTVVLKLTLPGGVESFMGKLTRLIGSGSDGTKDQGTS